MFKLSKKTEYGLLALQYMQHNAERNVATVREIAEFYNISQTLLAKIMQSLTRHKIIESVQGAQGGYALRQPANEISLAKVLEAIEGPIHITDCYQNNDCCVRKEHCTLRHRFTPLQNGIIDQLQTMTLAEFFKE